MNSLEITENYLQSLIHFWPWILVILCFIIGFCLLIIRIRPEVKYAKCIAEIIVYVSIILSFIYGLLDDSDSPLTPLLLSLVFLCLEIIVTSQTSIQSIIKDLKKYISNNPVFKSKDSHKQLVENLPSVCAPKSVLDFFKKTFEQVEKKGIIQIDVTKDDYTNFLLEVINATKYSIIGTFTSEPSQIKTEKSSSTIKYKEAINKLKTKVTRIVILTDKEIKTINDSLSSKTYEDENGKKNKYNQIEWFSKVFCKGINLYWVNEQNFKNRFDGNGYSQMVTFHNGTVSDFAVFDNSLLLAWQEYKEDKSERRSKDKYGNLLINWNDEVKIFAKEFSKNKIGTYDNFYNNFYELVSE